MIAILQGHTALIPQPLPWVHSLHKWWHHILLTFTSGHLLCIPDPTHTRRLTFPWMVSTHQSSWRQGLSQVLWMLQILTSWAISSSLSLHSLPSHKHLLESESCSFLWAWIGSLKTQQTSWIQRRTHNLTKIKPLIPSLCPIPYRSWLTLNSFFLSNQSAPFHGHRPHTHAFSMFHLESVTAAKLPQTQMFLLHLKYTLASHDP